jgi:hypothetical protein
MKAPSSTAVILSAAMETHQVSLTLERDALSPWWLLLSKTAASESHMHWQGFREAQYCEQDESVCLHVKPLGSWLSTK